MFVNVVRRGGGRRGECYAIRRGRSGRLQRLLDGNRPAAEVPLSGPDDHQQSSARRAALRPANDRHRMCRSAHTHHPPL